MGLSAFRPGGLQKGLYTQVVHNVGVDVARAEAPNPKPLRFWTLQVELPSST